MTEEETYSYGPEYRHPVMYCPLLSIEPSTKLPCDEQTTAVGDQQFIIGATEQLPAMSIVRLGHETRTIPMMQEPWTLATITTPGGETCHALLSDEAIKVLKSIARKIEL